MKFITFPLTGFVLSASMALANSGHEQHAALLRVDPALYTEAELIRLDDAMRENDTVTIAFLKGRAEGASVAQAAFVQASSDHQGKDMLAKIAGVNPGDYTLAELTAMTSTQSDD
jgi:hypothetical protein